MKNILLSLIFIIFGTMLVSARNVSDTAIADGQRRVNVQDTGKSGRPGPFQTKDQGNNGRRRPGVTLTRGKTERRKFDSTLFTMASEPTSGDYLENLDKVFQLLRPLMSVT
jgi:hypothetical protein